MATFSYGARPESLILFYLVGDRTYRSLLEGESITGFPVVTGLTRHLALF